MHCVVLAQLNTAQREFGSKSSDKMNCDQATSIDVLIERNKRLQAKDQQLATAANVVTTKLAAAEKKVRGKQEVIRELERAHSELIGKLKEQQKRNEVKRQTLTERQADKDQLRGQIEDTELNGHEGYLRKLDAIADMIKAAVGDDQQQEGQQQEEKQQEKMKQPEVAAPVKQLSRPM